jgi:hypothetical protein
VFFSKQGEENLFWRWKVTPLELQILIHCHVSPEQFPTFFAPVVVRVFNSYHMQKIIENDTQFSNAMNPYVFKLTPKGKAWLTLILDTPIPTAKVCYVDEKGEVIK